MVITVIVITIFAKVVIISLQTNIFTRFFKKLN